MTLIALMRRFTIRTRFVCAIAVVVSLLLMVGAAGMIGLTRTAALLDQFTETTYHDTVALAALQGATGNIRRYEKDLALNHADAAARSGYRAKWAKAVDDARAQARLIASDQNDEGSQIAARIVPRFDAYANRAEPVWKKLDEGAFADSQAVDRALGDAKQVAHELEVAVADLTAHLTKEAAASDAQRRVIHRHSVAWFVGALLLATLIVAPTTLANMMSICRPLEKAREQAERIAAGDLAQDIGDTSCDESGQMLRALGDMQAALRRLVGDVRVASENISTASAEIATGNADLSQRTEQTASNLQTAAGSLQQITTSVRQSAESASQANQLAASASAVAVRGGEAVGQVVATMGEIEASSRRIADIIGTIDGIAFQTNILSLNAAVEAARAGEQGRGFAVVAGEVRSLAQRSAEAAREIKALIGASVERVDAGTRLVRDAGATMNEIVDSVRRVTDVIGEITASTTEQSHAIVQVSGAVSQLDQMTQQNAALVEQSAAAAESLKEQAGRMVGVVAVFRTGEQTAFAATASPPRAASAPAPRDEPASTEPARQAQQAIARARQGPAPATGVTESDWESF